MTALPNLRDRQITVQGFWDMVNRGDTSLEGVPHAVRTILKNDVWREREVDGEIVRFERFADFITAKPRKGCGWPLDKVERLISHDAEALTLWRRAVTAPAHIHRRDNDNVIVSEQGNSRSYTLARLSDQRPDLHARVVSGELSANAAALEAGFRRPTRTVPVDTADSAMRALLRVFSADDLRRALDDAS